MRRVSSLLTAMPKEVSLRHVSKKGTVTEVTMSLMGRVDVMPDGTIARHWADNEAQVGMSVFVKQNAEGYAPSRTVMLTSAKGSTPPSIAQQLIRALFPDDSGMGLQVSHAKFEGNIWLLHSDEAIKVISEHQKPTRN